MANTSSAKKAARQAVKRTKINASRKSRMRTAVKKVEQALTTGDAAAAKAALADAGPHIVRTAQKGLIHKNTAARKISRLTKRLKALDAAR